MNIEQLESYNLADAVKFNDHLNPRLFGKDEHLLPDVRRHLLGIADDFREFLGVNGYELRDITISGSNAAYTYTPHSDIDLHLVVDLPQMNNEVYKELFNAKKYEYNDKHNIKISGYDVELYVQDVNQTHVSQGIYSVLNNDWVEVPRRQKHTINDLSTRSKYQDVQQRIKQAIASDDLELMSDLKHKISDMRKAGLAQNGELAQLQADVNEQQEITKRLQADMMSDSWLSKNIRPMTLIFILMTYTVFGMMSAWDIEVNNNYVELLGQWGMLIMSFYFGGRTLEKVMEMKKNGK